MKDTKSHFWKEQQMRCGPIVPTADALTTAMQQTAHRLGIDGANEAVHAIQNCEGIRSLLEAYRAGTLPGAPASSG